MQLPKSLTTVTTFSKILAGVLFVTLPLVGFYLGMEYEKELTPKSSPIVRSTPKSSTDSTADWKTYRIEKYEFEFKYPSDWKMRLEEYPTTTKIFLDSNVESTYSEDQRAMPTNPIFEKYYISFALVSKRDEFYIYEIKNAKQVTITGKTAYQTSKLPNNMVREFATYIDYSDDEYLKIGLSPYASDPQITGPEQKQVQEIYDQVISTLKFIPSSKESCEAAGGKWEGGINECNMPTKDAGKACYESNDCEGTCIAELSKEEQEKVKKEVLYTNGKCSAWKINYGCLPFVEDGKVDRIICLDLRTASIVATFIGDEKNFIDFDVIKNCYCRNDKCMKADILKCGLQWMRE